MSKAIKTRIFAAIISILVFAGAVGYVYGVMDRRPEKQEQDIVYEKARVIDLLEDRTQVDENAESIKKGSQDILIEITSGELKGKQFETTNYMGMLYNIDCQPGTKIIVSVQERSDGDYGVNVYSYNRESALVIAAVIFMALLCLIGGKKGVMSLVSLLYTLAGFFFLLLPALYFGAPVLPTTIGVIGLTTVASFIFIDGVNKKTFSAIAGTLCGILVAGIFAFILGKVVHITGFQTPEAESLLLVGSDYGLKITDLFTAGILISAMGAVMDVAMSIASAVWELHSINPELGRKQLFLSGMNIGRDAMGTMSNTLILAFVGTSLNFMIMVMSYQIPTTQLLSTDLVAREMIQGLSGSIGIIMTVPFVALLSALIMSKEKNKSR